MSNIRNSTLVGAYYVERPLKHGRGGMAQAYLAKIYSTGTPVALKVALASDKKNKEQDTFYQAINNEVSILKQLRHPNIVHIYPILKSGLAREPFIACALDVPGQPWYFVMEYLQGPRLEELIDQRKGLSIEESVEVAFQIGMALEFMHSQDCAHLDIKPSNIMFRRSVKSPASSFEPVLIDFGVAAKSKQVVIDAGSIPFLPPERLLYLIGELPSDQITNHQAIDVYGMGVTLYKMVTGRLPFKISGRNNITSTVLNKPPPQPRQLNPEIPPRLEQLILRTLSKASSDRPTINEMVAELDRIKAPPRLFTHPGVEQESPQKPWQDWLDKYPRWAVSLSTVALALVVAAMIFLVGRASVSTPATSKPTATITTTATPPPTAIKTATQAITSPAPTIATSTSIPPTETTPAGTPGASSPTLTRQPTRMPTETTPAGTPDTIPPTPTRRPTRTPTNTPLPAPPPSDGEGS